MRKISIWICLAVGIVLAFFTQPVKANPLFTPPIKTNSKYTDFASLVEHANFARVWLGLCPQRLTLTDPSAKDLASKICTDDLNVAVTDLMNFLIAINVYGNFDPTYDDFNLPGVKYGNRFNGNNNADQAFIPYNPGVKELVPRLKTGDLTDSDNKNETCLKGGATSLAWCLQQILEAINQKLDIPKAVDRIKTSCRSNKNSDDYKLCNDLLAVNEPNYNNIFHQTKLTKASLQQLYYNSLSFNSESSQSELHVGNSEAIRNSIKSYETAYQKSFAKLDTDLLNQTIGFGKNFNFQFKTITAKTEKNDVKNYFMPGGLGWLIDALANMTSSAAEGLYSTLMKWFMAINIDLTSNPSLKLVWQNFRNIANFIFIIIFMIMIISQITNIGLSNYSVKKLLPKLLVTVILVNLSYYFTQIIIDLSNIIGRSIFSMLVGAAQPQGGFAERYHNFLSIQGGIALILYILLFIVAAILAILAFIINIVLLTIRDALAIILIVVSPFCLACGVMPNTERIHQVWWRALINVTSIFPVVSLLVGGGVLINNIIISQPSVELTAFIMGQLALMGALVTIPFIVANTLSKIDAFAKVGKAGLIASLPLIGGFASNPTNFAKGAIGQFNKTRFAKQFETNRNQKQLNRLANKQGGFWAQAAADAQKQISSQQNTQAGKYDQNSARSLINAMYNESRNITPNYTNIDQATMNNFTYQRRLAGGTKNTALALAKAYAQDSANHKQTDASVIIKALAVARQNGASQNELSQNFNELIDTFKNKGDFRSIGLLNAALKHDNNFYGNTDLDELVQADVTNLAPDASTSVTNLHNLIREETQKALHRQQIDNASQSTDLIHNLNSNMVEPGSVANQVLIETLDSNKSVRDELLNNYKRLDSQTQEALGADRELLQNYYNQRELVIQDVEDISLPAQDRYNNLAIKIRKLKQVRDDNFDKFVQEFLINSDAKDMTRARSYARNKVRFEDSIISAKEDSLNQLLARHPDIDASYVNNLTNLQPNSTNLTEFDHYRNALNADKALESIKQSIVDSMRRNNGF